MGVETATIVVSDLVASTELRVALGEERADALRRDLDLALSQAVTSHGGTVVKGLGDGLLSAFPGASDAVGAGVAMQQACARLGQQLGGSLELRVGASAGDVTFEGGDCFGTPVVEASRLCTLAEGGQVLVADVVRVLARGRSGHRFEESRAVDLKGLPERVLAWTVPWEPLTGAAALRQPSPFVGRGRELAVLSGAIAAAAEGRGATVLVSGEPGMGKSRLVEEVCRSEPSVTVLWGGCHDGDVAPGAAVAEAVMAWARATSPDEVAELLATEGPVLATVAPALRTLLPDLPEPAPIPGDVAAARLEDAVRQWITRVAATTTVALVLDDLHWADGTTVRLLRCVARAAEAKRIVVIGTYRETDLDRSHPFADALQVLRREVEPSRLALRGLDPEDVEVLLEGLAGHDVSPAFAGLLAEQCGGNPFFLRETLLHLVEEGKLVREDGEWRAATSDLSIPEGVREVLGRRLARLSPVANRLLVIGALSEVGFSLPVVCEVADVAEEDALDALDEALGAQIVRSTGEFDRYAFTHALFRHTLVQELNPSRQVRAHRALADAIEKRLRDDASPAQAATLARHFFASSALPGAERGVPYAMAAAAHAERSAAFREAYDLYEVARDLLGADDDREIEVQRRLATSAVLAQVAVDDQVAETARLGELVEEARGSDAAADELSELVTIAGGLDERTTTWRLASVARRWLRPDRRDTTWTHLRSWELDEMESMDPNGMGLSLDTPERRELNDVVWRTPGPLKVGGYPSAPGRRVLLRWLEHPQEPDTVAWLLFAAATDPHRLVAACAESADAARAGGRLAYAALESSFGVRARLVIGDHDGADEALADAVALLPRIDERSNAAFLVLACYAFAGWIRGAPENIVSRGGEVRRSEDVNTRSNGTALRGAGAYTRAWRDMDTRALGQIESILPAVQGAAGSAPNYPLILHFAVGVHWWLERRDHLDVLHRNLEEKVLAQDQRYLETDGRWIAARIASLDGDHAAARRWFDAARDELRPEGMWGLLTSVEFDAALAESRAGEHGDPGRFDAAAAEVRRLSRHPAMAPWLRRLASLVPPAGARPLTDA